LNRERQAEETVKENEREEREVCERVSDASTNKPKFERRQRVPCVKTLRTEKLAECDQGADEGL